MPKGKPPVALVKECRDGKFRIVRRFWTVPAAVARIGRFRNQRDVEAGLYAIDAPERR
jgi:hypothetical protein